MKAAPGKAALLVIDMINPLDFPGGEVFVKPALAAVDGILALRSQADRLGLPTVYVNDNFGRWHADRTRLVERSLAPGAPGRPIVERLQPRDQDVLVIKPMHSGFYATNLPVLLPKLGVSRVVLTGMSAEICVLFTAADAHMRDYGIWVPEDGVAAPDERRKHWALAIIKEALTAEIRPSTQLSLTAWIEDQPKRDKDPACQRFNI